MASVQETFILGFRAQGTRRVRRDIEGIGKSASGVRRTLAFLRAALVVVASARIVTGFFRLADSLTLIQNRLRLVTNSTQTLNAVQSELFAISQRTRTSFEQNAQVFARFARSTANLDLTYRQLLEITEAVNQAIQISGATTQEARNSIIQFSQGLAAGAVRGEELRSVVEQFPRLAETIAKAVGLSAGALAAFARTSSEEQIRQVLGTETVINAIFSDMRNLEREFSDIDITIGQAFEKFTNKLTVFSGQLNRATGLGRFFINMLETLSNNIGTVVAALTVLTGVVVFNILADQVFRLIGYIRLLGALSVYSLGLVSGATAGVVNAFTALPRLIINSTTAIGKGSLKAAGVMQKAFISSLTVVVKAFRNFIAGPLTAIRLLGLTAVAAGKRMAAAFLVGLAPLTAGALAIAGVVALFVIFRKEIGQLFERFGSLRDIITNTIDVTVAGVSTIIKGWRLLPGAIADIAIQAVNELIEWFEFGTRKAADFINVFLPENLEIDTGGITFDGLENKFKGKAAELAEFFKAELEDVVERGGGIAVIEESFGRLVSFFQDFTSLPAGDDSLLDKIPDLVKGTDQLDEVSKSYQRLLDKVFPFEKAQRELNEANETATKILRKKQAALRDVVVQQDAEAFSLKRFNEALQEVIKAEERRAQIRRFILREEAGLGHAQQEYLTRLRLINQAVSEGAATEAEAVVARREAAIEFLNTQRDATSGAQRFFLKLQQDARDTASQVEDVLGSAFQKLEDMFVNFIETGKFKFSDFIDFIILEMVRVQFRRAAASFSDMLVNSAIGTALGFGQNALAGAGAGAASAGASASASTQFSGRGYNISSPSANEVFGNFAHGGSFTVGSDTSLANLSGVDNRLVAFRARDGEEVNVSRPGQINRGGDVEINVIDQRGSDSPPVQVTETESNGRRQIQVMIEGEVKRLFETGRMDRSMNRSFGLSRRSQG